MRLLTSSLCISLVGACGASPGLAQPRLSPDVVVLQRENYQKVIEGKSVDLYTLKNSQGMTVRITNFGAKVMQILVPDRDGVLGDVAQGYDSIDADMNGQISAGAFMGRYANRIANGHFNLDGVEYKLAINDLSTPPAPPRQNTLHGGKVGARLRVFDAKQLSDNCVEMTLLFKDGEEGFPGDLPLRVRYMVTEDNALLISYDAVAATKKTVANFTSHILFNLSGQLGSPVLDELLTIDSERVLEVTDALVPSGKMRDVADSPMDFRQPKLIGRDIDAHYDLIEAGNGYDIHYALKHYKQGELRFNARVEDAKSGRVLEVWSTEPGIQFYSGNFLAGKVPRDAGKGQIFQFRSAFGLEPSHYPDSVNHPEFPSTVLEPGQWYSGSIAYRFSVQP